MSRIVWPSIAATCVALYFISRKRKLEIDVELEPMSDGESESETMVDDALMAK